MHVNQNGILRKAKAIEHHILPLVLGSQVQGLHFGCAETQRNLGEIVLLGSQVVLERSG